MKNILITGSSGFLGTRLVERLQNTSKYNIFETTFDNEEVSKNCLFLDLQDRKSIETIFSQNSIDTVVHLAGIASIPICENNPEKCFDVNVRGSKYLAEIAKKQGVSLFLNLSSNKVVKAKNQYGINKKIVEQELYNLKSDLFTTVSYRCGNVLTAPNSFLLDWKNMHERNEIVKSTGKGVFRNFISPMQVVRDIETIIKNYKNIGSGILIPTLKSGEINSFLTIFADIFKAKTFVAEKRMIDNSYDFVFDSDENKFCELIEIENQKYGLLTFDFEKKKQVKDKELVQNITNKEIREIIEQL